MKEVSAKKVLINALTDTVYHLSKNGEIDEKEEPYFTYVTASGYITGKEKRYKTYEFDEEITLSDCLKNLYEDEKDNMSIASLVDITAKYYANNYEKEEIAVSDRGKHIFLEDVTINKYDGSKSVSTKDFILFLDQVIGVIPGRNK
ncbi:hypothetical protein [Bacillus albus]|uniref:hypothetical protein n=1 Tax=Bacillus albus TaxID=2026189 RepID=UPI001021B101|nr:hypothetical protein [Bacillus albus]